MIGNIITIMFLVYIVSFLVGILITIININSVDTDDMGRIMVLGLGYWIYKLVTLPIKRKKNKKKTKEEHEQNINDRLIRHMGNFYGESINTIIREIEELKNPISPDLYSRAVTAYHDLKDILIKCSDGEGHIDNDNFKDVVKNTLTECCNVVGIAWEEMNSRVEEDKKNYYKDKKESIKKDLENMINKNRDFKEMWNKK